MAIDRGVIDAQLREIGEGERWWEQREFRDLPHILHAGEQIQGLTLGKLLGRKLPRVKPSGRWLLVATDQRLICLRQERFGRKQIEITPGQIVRVQQSNRLGSFQLAVQTPQRRIRIRIPKVDAFRFTGALASLIPKPAVRQLSPELEAWSWLPGITTVASLPGVSGIVSKVSMLSPPDYATRAHAERLETLIERLQSDVERLQQQVVFLEDLLEKRADAGFLPQSQQD